MMADSSSSTAKIMQAVPSPSQAETSHVLSTLAQLTHLLQSNRDLHSQLTSTAPILPPNIPLNPSSQLLQTALPAHPTAPDQLLAHLTSAVLPYLNQSSLSPHYYGFVTGGATPAALLGDFLASIYDQNVAVHLPAQTIATNVEVAALNMLVELMGLSRNDWSLPGASEGGAEGRGAGIFTTGATASNVLGLALGREWVLNTKGNGMSVGEHGLADCMRATGVEIVKILSTMPHSSIAKAASIVGLGRASVVSIASESDPLMIDIAKLEAEVAKNGRRARYILSVSSGEVNTGRFATDSFNQMKGLRRVCDQHGIWMHVDGAFGLFGRVLIDPAGKWEPKYNEIVKGVQGLELADSITGDAHKLLNVPYDCGFFLTRHRGLNEQVCRNGNAAYLSSGAGSDDGIASPLNIGIENSRRFRALPVYATLLQYGRAGYRDMLERQITLSRRVAAWIFDHPDFDLLPLGEDKDQMIAKTYMIVLFRAKAQTRDNHLVDLINATGKIYVTGTAWDGRPAARIAVSNWQVDVDRDSQRIFDVLEKIFQSQVSHS